MVGLHEGNKVENLLKIQIAIIAREGLRQEAPICVGLLALWVH